MTFTQYVLEKFLDKKRMIVDSIHTHAMTEDVTVIKNRHTIFTTALSTGSFLVLMNHGKSEIVGIWIAQPVVIQKDSKDQFEAQGKVFYIDLEGGNDVPSNNKVML